MTKNIWTKCGGGKQITQLKETVWRMELQNRSFTRNLVDSLEEQEILDRLLEINISYKIDPLLFKPFKYPPLKYGSRFGKRTEPSL